MSLPLMVYGFNPSTQNARWDWRKLSAERNYALWFLHSCAKSHYCQLFLSVKPELLLQILARSGIPKPTSTRWLKRFRPGLQPPASPVSAIRRMQKHDPRSTCLGEQMLLTCRHSKYTGKTVARLVVQMLEEGKEEEYLDQCKAQHCWNRE